MAIKFKPARIVKGNCIEERYHYRLTKKALTYSVATTDPAQQAKALEIHRLIYFTMLKTDDDRMLVTSKWIGFLVQEILRLEVPLHKLPKRLKDHFSKLGSFPAKTHAKKIEDEQPPVVPLKEKGVGPILWKSASGSIKKYMFDFVKKIINEIHAPSLPYWDTKREESAALIEIFLQKGTLMVGDRSPIACNELFQYRIGLSVRGRESLSRRIGDMQGVFRNGAYWIEYFDSLNVSNIEEVNSVHINEFQTWRVGKRMHGTPTLRISRTQIQREHTFIRNFFRYVVAMGYLSTNPTDDLKILRVKEHDENGDPKSKGKEYRNPIPLPKLKVMLLHLPRRLASMKQENGLDILWKNSFRLKWLTFVFLLCTGCRPKESNEWTIRNGHLAIEGRKTKNSIRNIPLSPTLFQITSDPIMQENQRFSGMGTRITSFLQANFDDSVTSYQIRHTVATLLLICGDLPIQKIAHWMAHESSVLTEKVYGHMTEFQTPGYEQEVKEFWHWLNHKYFDEIDIETGCQLLPISMDDPGIGVFQ